MLAYVAPITCHLSLIYLIYIEWHIESFPILLLKTEMHYIGEGSLFTGLDAVRSHHT